jgi:hypothetical protein
MNAGTASGVPLPGAVDVGFVVGQSQRFPRRSVESLKHAPLAYRFQSPAEIVRRRDL